MHWERGIQIEVKEANGNWYANAFVENTFDALRVAKFYKEELGYIVRVTDMKTIRDITFLLDNMTLYRVPKE